MLLFLLLSLIKAEILDCPIIQNECSDNYEPVCGLNITESPVQTFLNFCFACKATQVVKYEIGECKENNDTTKSQNPNTSIDVGNQTISAGNYTQLISCSDPRPSICGTYNKTTCGFFDSTIQCSEKNCFLEFQNECQACRNTSIHSYFYGNCSDYIPQQPTIIQCSQQDGKQCDVTEKTDVCGFLDQNSICQNPPCLQPFENTCDVCKQENITSFYIGQCNQYKELFSVAEQETDTFVQSYQYCSPQRPFECNLEYQQTCGIQKSCQGNGCERTFDNSCQACQNSDIEGFYIGECKNWSLILSIIFVQFIF